MAHPEGGLAARVCVCVCVSVCVCGEREREREVGGSAWRGDFAGFFGKGAFFGGNDWTRRDREGGRGDEFQAQRATR